MVEVERGSPVKRILIVDDEPEIRDVYRRLLVDEGYEVILAENAMEAHELLGTNPVDLILLDIKMPEVNGGIFHWAMRLFHRDVKVIVSSVYPVEEQRHIIELATDYFDKAQGTAVLLRKVRAVIGKPVVNPGCAVKLNTPQAAW